MISLQQVPLLSDYCIWSCTHTVNMKTGQALWGDLSSCHTGRQGLCTMTRPSEDKSTGWFLHTGTN